MIIFRLQVTHDAGKSAEDPAGRGAYRACGWCPYPSGHHGHQQVDVTCNSGYISCLYCFVILCIVIVIVILSQKIMQLLDQIHITLYHNSQSSS